MAVVVNEVHPLVSHRSYGLGIRIAQFIFASLVLGLSAYTVSILTDWREIRFTVATGAWGVISTLWALSLGLEYRPKSHHWLLTFFEFTNWGMFLAVWIALSVNVGQDTWCVNPDGSHSHTRECNTAYTALAFAIVEWLLFTATMLGVGYGIGKYREGVAPAHEKTAGAGVRPSDDGTLRAEGNTAV